MTQRCARFKVHNPPLPLPYRLVSHSTMSLLIIAAPTVAPTPFIHSLTQGTDTVWTIDNKYYSARVDVVVRGVEDVGQVDTVEAVIYLYDNVRGSLSPPGLFTLITYAGCNTPGTPHIPRSNRTTRTIIRHPPPATFPLGR